MLTIKCNRVFPQIALPDPGIGFAGGLSGIASLIPLEWHIYTYQSLPLPLPSKYSSLPTDLLWDMAPKDLLGQQSIQETDVAFEYRASSYSQGTV